MSIKVQRGKDTSHDAPKTDAALSGSSERPPAQYVCNESLPGCMSHGRSTQGVVHNIAFDRLDNSSSDDTFWLHLFSSLPWSGLLQGGRSPKFDDSTNARDVK